LTGSSSRMAAFRVDWRYALFPSPDIRGRLGYRCASDPAGSDRYGWNAAAGFFNGSEPTQPESSARGPAGGNRGGDCDRTAAGLHRSAAQGCRFASGDAVDYVQWCSDTKFFRGAHRLYPSGPGGGARALRRAARRRIDGLYARQGDQPRLAGRRYRTGQRAAGEVGGVEPAVDPGSKAD